MRPHFYPQYAFTYMDIHLVKLGNSLANYKMFPWYGYKMHFHLRWSGHKGRFLQELIFKLKEDRSGRKSFAVTKPLAFRQPSNLTFCSIADTESLLKLLASVQDHSTFKTAGTFYPTSGFYMLHRRPSLSQRKMLLLTH